MNFPADYPFQLVIRRSGGGGGGGGGDVPQALLEHYRQLVAETCAADIPLERCSAKERLGGKYVSLCIPARVPSAHVVDLVFARLAGDADVLMKY